MKANAPEKLYLISDEDGVMLSYDPSTKLQYGDRYDFVDKAVFSIEEGCEVEYVRKDAFIEKACDWLRTHSEVDYFELIPDANYCGAGNINKKRMIDEFRKYMKGE